MIIITGEKGIGKSTILSGINKGIDALSIYTFFKNDDLFIKILNKSLKIAKRYYKYKCLVPIKVNMDSTANIIENISVLNYKYIFFDEIGFIEECSLKFKKTIFYLMNKKNDSVFVLKMDDSPFIKKIERNFRQDIIHISEKNRNFIFSELKKLFKDPHSL
ncbi:MAG: nucleoside-triphosphatase [Kosmotogales bacterium]|nr:nucleoside-triphosphatase [Kosmotogales bacterium]